MLAQTPVDLILPGDTVQWYVTIYKWSFRRSEEAETRGGQINRGGLMEGHRITWNQKGWQRCEWERKTKEVSQAGGMVEGYKERCRSRNELGMFRATVEKKLV